MAAEVEAVRGPRIGKAAMERLFGLRARARAAAARALGAPEEEVALTSSTSHGIGLVCAGLDWSQGGEVGDHHRGAPGPARAAGRARPALRRRRAGGAGAELLAAIGPATRMVAVSHVLWTTGLVLPLPEIATAAHAVGATVLVDARPVGRRDPARHARERCGLLRGVGAEVAARAAGHGRPVGASGPLRACSGRRRRATSRTTAATSARCAPAPPGTTPAASITIVLAGFAARWSGSRAGRADVPPGTSRRPRRPRRRAPARHVPGVAVHDPGGPSSGLIALRLEGYEPADAVARLAERDVLVRPIPDTPVRARLDRRLDGRLGHRGAGRGPRVACVNTRVPAPVIRCQAAGIVRRRG